MTRDRSHLKIFTEIGYGNRHFVSTEIEHGDREKRVRGFTRMHVRGIYIRVWIGYKVFILSTTDGFEHRTKPKTRFKILFGLSGRGKAKTS